MNPEALIDEFISECQEYAAELIPELVQKMIDALNEDHKEDFPVDEWSFFDEMTVINERVYDVNFDEYLENVYNVDIFEYINHVIETVTWEQYHFLKYAYLGHSNELDTHTLSKEIWEQFNKALVRNADSDKVIEAMSEREEEPDDDSSQLELQDEEEDTGQFTQKDSTHEELTVLGVKLAFGLIERGILKFADFCRKMIETFGDDVRPYLKMYYVGAMFDPAMPADLFTQMTPAEEIRDFDVYNFDKELAQEPIHVEKTEESSPQLEFEQEARPKVTPFKNEVDQKVAEWEKENGRSIKSLPLDEWLDVMSVIMVCPRFELEEMVNNHRASRY